MADARLLEAAPLQVAEAALTGGSVPVVKNAAALPDATGLADRHDMVHAGTHVTASARALAVTTGAHTEVGRIAGLTAGAQEPKTPLVRSRQPMCIVEQEQERDCDLVVLGKHGQSAAEELLLGSVTKHVLAEGACDVLVSTSHESAG